jgi:hypothetical protein
MPSVVQNQHATMNEAGAGLAVHQSGEYNAPDGECYIVWGEKIRVTPAQKAKWDAFWDYAIELSSRLP